MDAKLNEGRPGDPGRDPRLRRLPALGRLLEAPEAKALADESGRAGLTEALRSTIGEARRALQADPRMAPPDEAALLARAAARVAEARVPRLRGVINATGVVLHTNLGRAPLAEAALEAIFAAAGGYCDLELDLETGRRGARLAGVEARLASLAGTEGGLAVNNGAAALLLALSALAAGGEVVVSRGELVEIGGGFRIPDVVVQGGARLVEVGTTNRTRLADYAAAIGPATRVLLKVHRSNYRMTGFTAEATGAELAGLARANGLLLVHDLGSGAVQPLADEPTIAEAAAFADLVTFSGDKLLGGPQAGLIAGRTEALARLRTHPLLRALRLDKLSAAALEATLALHADPAAARRAIPALRMLHEAEADRVRRADALAALLGGAATAIVPTEGRAGGGTLPAHPIPSRAVALADNGELARRLRLGTPAVLGRLHEGWLLLDVLAVAPDEIETLADAVQAAGADR